MASSSPASRWLRRATVVIAALSAVVAGVPAVAAAAGDQRVLSPAGSHITTVTVNQNTTVGTFNGAAYVRLVGTVDGVVAPGEAVVGLDALPKDTAGNYHYSAQFELITTAPGQPRSNAVVVEAENRGNPFLFGGLQGLPGLTTGSPATIVYPAGLGNGFLQDYGLSWARVQWQGPNGATTINPTVPTTAQGVGEVIMRDFALLLRGLDGSVGRRAGLNSFGKLLLMGVSQSAWFVNAFIADGFNALDRGRHHLPLRVFDGAYTQDGVGNWLGLNQTNQANGFTTQTSYVQPNGVPLTPSQLLRRPLTDPFLVDTTAYTDFYRVRASVWNSSHLPWNVREYNLPVPHTSGRAVAPGTVPTQLGCDVGGTPIPALNPLDTRPYARAAIVGLARTVRVVGLRAPAPFLARTTQFRRTAGPTAPDLDQGNAALPLFNFLPGVDLTVPVANNDNMPVGGVTFPEAALPVGIPTPVSVPPVATRSITDTCGNFGGWRPLTAAQLQARYGSVDRYLAAYANLLDRLIDQRYILASDRQTVLDQARDLYNAAA